MADQYHLAEVLSVHRSMCRRSALGPERPLARPQKEGEKEEVFPSAGKHQVHLILISFVCGISFFPKKLRPNEGREPDQAR